MFLYAVFGSLVGQSLVVYFPPLQAIFQTEALGFFDICSLLALASSVWILDEVRKFFRRRYSHHHRGFAANKGLHLV